MVKKSEGCFSPGEFLREKLDFYAMRINKIYRDIDYDFVRRAGESELVDLKRKVAGFLRGYFSIEGYYYKMKKSHHPSYSMLQKRVKDISTCVEQELMLRFPCLN